jgi:hypothetical protein
MNKDNYQIEPNTKNALKLLNIIKIGFFHHYRPDDYTASKIKHKIKELHINLFKVSIRKPGVRSYDIALFAFIKFPRSIISELFKFGVSLFRKITKRVGYCGLTTSRCRANSQNDVE